MLTLVVSAMVATKGLMLTQSDCPETVTYGEKLGFRAGFLFSRTRYEYQEEGSSRWTTETPVTPGVYAVRASGKTSFGSRNYTDTYTFTIQPREITVSVSDSSITYGETPRVTADLAKGDSINCEILYARYAPTTQVWVNPDNLTITDKNGNDRTDCYLISATPRSTIRITPRPLTVTVQDASKVYDDLYLTFDGYEISKGSLFGEDQLVALFYDSIRDVGSIPNTPTLHVYSSEGEDMTELYNITIQSGTLSVEQRPLIVKTGSKSFVYSGQSMYCEEYSVDSSTSLVKGHRLQARIFASILDCGTVANAMIFDVYGDGGRNVTDNYSVFVEAGTLTMTPRPVVLTTESATFVYDGTDQTHPYATVKNGVGDECRVVQSSSICDVGSVENRMTVEFYRGSKNVTENYTITGYNFGTLTVTKRPISVLMENAEKPYDGTPL
ncbi:MAG: hypothetical protein IKU90_07500, partial [Clostridia bacterium]|nr:hypothetical protein [Clostridia bacterium]